ncbi:hypothetical protein SRHO_G00165290 [Serrasalmus rhombeus]
MASEAGSEALLPGVRCVPESTPISAINSSAARTEQRGSAACRGTCSAPRTEDFPLQSELRITDWTGWSQNLLLDGFMRGSSGAPGRGRAGCGVGDGRAVMWLDRLHACANL